MRTSLFLLALTASHTAFAAPAFVDGFRTLLGATSDGKQVLVRIEGKGAPDTYRRVDVATNTTIADFQLPALSSIPHETISEGDGSVRSMPVVANPKLEADIVRLASELAPLVIPDRNDARFVARGGRVVFNVGDWLYVADAKTGKVGSRISAQAAYAPILDANGSLAIYRGYAGKLDGVVGNYMPFIVQLPSGTPRRIEVRDAGLMVTSRDVSTLYVVSGTGHPGGGCLYRVPLTHPSTPVAITCAQPHERIEEAVFSPNRTFAAVMVDDGSMRRAVFIDLVSGKRTGQISVKNGAIGGITDQGALVGVNGRDAFIAETPAKVRILPNRPRMYDGIFVGSTFVYSAWYVMGRVDLVP